MVINCTKPVKVQVHHELHSNIRKQANLYFGTNINLKAFKEIVCFTNALNLVDLLLRLKVDFKRCMKT
jgi:hypothetical protein